MIIGKWFKAGQEHDWTDAVRSNPRDVRGNVLALDDVVIFNDARYRIAVGVIDSGYRGEIHAPLINLGYEDVELEAGTRVCQLVIMPFVPCELVPVESLGETERGADGFGSTGCE